MPNIHILVIPAKAGIHHPTMQPRSSIGWIPACAGMTKVVTEQPSA
jgi:hypothetical protein